jgi:hypothetical protein
MSDLNVYSAQVKFEAPRTATKICTGMILPVRPSTTSPMRPANVDKQLLANGHGFDASSASRSGCETPARRIISAVPQPSAVARTTINRYLGEHNRKPKPFVWTPIPTASSRRSIEGIKGWRQTTLMSAFPSSRRVNLWLP